MAGSESAQLAEAVATLEAELAGEEEAAGKAKEAMDTLSATAKVRRPTNSMRSTGFLISSGPECGVALALKVTNAPTAPPVW